MTVAIAAAGATPAARRKLRRLMALVSALCRILGSIAAAAPLSFHREGFGFDLDQQTAKRANGAVESRRPGIFKVYEEALRPGFQVSVEKPALDCCIRCEL